MVKSVVGQRGAQRAADRLTISLGKGQKAALQAVAEANHTSLSFVLRHALEKFINENKNRQLPIVFPLGEEEIGR
jgi:predicted transcriptional regulator